MSKRNILQYIFILLWFFLYFYVHSNCNTTFQTQYIFNNVDKVKKKDKLYLENNLYKSKKNLSSKNKLFTQYKHKKSFNKKKLYSKNKLFTQYKNKNSFNKKKNLIVIGERNSGTNMLYNALRECYGEKYVYQSFARDKHWQQDEYVFKTKNINKKMLNIYNAKNYIIFVQMRSVYNWIPAMRARPYEMPAHIHVRHNLTKFILKKWTMEKPKEDTQKTQCQGNFPNDKYVIPCIDYRGIYELDYLNGGKPFENILDFRAAKIRNWLNMTKWNKYVFFLKLEDYYKNKTKFLSNIENIVGFTCKNKKSFQVDFKKHNKMKVRVDPLFKYVSNKKSSEDYFLTPAEKKLIRKLTNWELEKLVGYNEN